MRSCGSVGYLRAHVRQYHLVSVFLLQVRVLVTFLQHQLLVAALAGTPVQYTSFPQVRRAICLPVNALLLNNTLNTIVAVIHFVHNVHAHTLLIGSLLLIFHILLGFDRS